ncbi:GntR family transcriptional regulator [Variovorax sp. J22R24]|uniref:GntR family transcriptional regulator n=1 Tax=Variovorax gracilis TaxID=3053502 RepID=UPI00257565BC|nr:GntR family transcriptional regulator [Variovorax sp. J22R24]MDM0109502.1 GntR family transcriptional regulator [Variovorax sp. J22R24]
MASTRNPSAIGGTARAEAEAQPARAKQPLRQLMTLPEQIAERIFTAIADGEYEPGERIREEALAEQFEVSRGPVREALRILEKDSVVRILPNRGAHVTQLSSKEVADIFEIRRKLSAAMVARLSAEEAARVAAAIDADVRALDALAQDEGGDAEYFQTSYRLSRVLRESCTNERLAEILASLSRQTLRYTQLGLATQARRRESARNWKSMQKALKAGNVEVAAEAVEKLIEDSKREAMKQLEARQGSATTNS